MGEAVWVGAGAESALSIGPRIGPSALQERWGRLHRRSGTCEGGRGQYGTFMEALLAPSWGRRGRRELNILQFVEGVICDKS